MEKNGSKKNTSVTQAILEDNVSLNATQLHNKKDTRLVENAVRGMLPKNKLGADLFRNLRVYGGAEHSQEAQNPKTININDYL